MAESTTVIANLALAHIGAGKEIANLDSENSQEANICRRHYETVRDMVLRDVPWPFATKIASLTLVETSPNNEWGYSYRYPFDCIRFRKIQGSVRNYALDNKIVYRITKDDSGLLILTDEQSAIGEWTVTITNTALFPADFTMALSLLLAVYIAPSLTRGDPFRLMEKIKAIYEQQKGMAIANAFNEEGREANPESEFIRGRS